MKNEGLNASPADRTAMGVEERAAAALTGMEALRISLERKVAELNALGGDQIKAADLTGLQRDLGRAVTLLLAEEGKVADALRSKRGGDGIDLGAARVEIGRRLDRIRATLDEGEVPEGPG